MKKQKKKSAVPIYAVGLVWLSCSLSGNLTTFWQIIKCAAISGITYLIMKLFFPDKEVLQDNQDEKKTEKTEQKKPAQEKTPEQKKTGKDADESSEMDLILRQRDTSIKRIQELNDEIPDYKLSAQILQIEILTQKIFDYVSAHPEKLKEIKQFMGYYLPTTIKLLEQYVVLQNQGMRLGNIDEGMKKIEDMLDKVIVAFQKQLDSLFESDVVDITADIRVMEQMMASQGLTGGQDF